MAANSESFPWPSYYGHYDFFEGRMDRHGKVAALVQQREGVYDLTLKDGRALRAFICECYAFGVAEFMEVVERIGSVDVVIIDSAWCGYSPEAKRHCREIGVGLFKIGEFMAALNRKDFWNYLTEQQTEYFEACGWL